MQAAKPHLTQHRRQRLVLWALALLTWLSSALLAPHNGERRFRQRTHDAAFHRLRQTIARLILLRAHDFARLRQRAPARFHQAGRKLRPAHLKRSYIGARLRRALKRKDMRAQITILLDALAHLDAWAARFVNRIKRGLTRLWPRRASRAPAQPIRSGFAPPPALADSS